MGARPIVQASALPSIDVGGDGRSRQRQRQRFQPSSQPGLVKGLVDFLGIIGAVSLVNTGPVLLVSGADVTLCPWQVLLIPAFA